MCLLVNQEKSDWNPKNIFSWISLIYATDARIKDFVVMLMSFVPALRCLLPSMLKGLRPLFLYLLVAVMSLKL